LVLSADIYSIQTLKRKMIMAKDLKRVLTFDEIIFKTRNKEYGAYILRKKYFRTVIISLISGVSVLAAFVITPYLDSELLLKKEKRPERKVEIKMENLSLPDETVAPPPPPPSSLARVIQQIKYVAPIVVDSIKPEESVKLMTSDQAQDESMNDIVEMKKEVKDEVHEEETSSEPFMYVEEMPVPAGGESGLLKFIADNTNYPVVARENNIQGKVFVRFCVTPSGSIDLVSIYKSVDPELDAEAMRVVKSLPPFKPGKNQGKPVPVWFIVPFDFKLQ
jgi:protein TonB